MPPVMDNPNFRFVKADICNREAVNKLFEEEHPDMVVNFAAEFHVDRSIENPGKRGFGLKLAEMPVLNGTNALIS